MHLAMGSLSLARAELESLAARDALDGPGMRDLAEVRWRTGDLALAGEAADRLLKEADDDPLTLVIAAEAVAAAGRPAEARRLASRAVEVGGDALEALFRGIPRSAIWPESIGPQLGPGARPEPPATGLAGASAPPEDRTLEPSAPPVPGEPAAPEPRSAPPTPAAAAAAPGQAASALAAGRAALDEGDAPVAALRLAVALRLDAATADAVSEAIGSRAAEPVLALVLGDALRLLGREPEAQASFEVAAAGAIPETISVAGAIPEAESAEGDGPPSTRPAPAAEAAEAAEAGETER